MKFTIGKISFENVWVYDVEVFKNLFLFIARNGDSWIEFEASKTSEFRELCEWIPGKILCGFNNDAFDDVILKYILENIDEVMPIDCYNLAGAIINNHHQEVVRHYLYMEKHWKMSIDVFQLLNNKGSLKEWMAKNGMEKVKELGHQWGEPLPLSMREENKSYCRNDVLGTTELLKRYWHLVELRTNLKSRYGLGEKVYCLSEARIAQHTFLTLHERKTGQSIAEIRRSCRKNKDNRVRSLFPQEIVFDYVRFETDKFKEMFDRLMKVKFTGNSTGGSWSISDKTFNRQIEIGSRKYKLGVGGIHSVDKPGRFESDDEYSIIDLDVTSYYPSIIINNELFPKHIGKGFIDDMIMLRDQRVEAKKSGDKKTADALKIVINSTFGKLNDMYSPIRSIPDALRVTVNGQLMMLMFVERIEQFCEIISANTDGVTVKILKSNIKLLNSSVRWWQNVTKHELELVEYLKFWRRDVNNYLAVYSDGKIKGKGEFSTDVSHGKSDGRIITEAAIKYISEGISIRKTVKSCSDISKFLYYQKIKNGGDVWCEDSKGEKHRVGSIVRWFVSNSPDSVALYRRNPKNRESVKKQAEFVRLPCGASAYIAMDLSEIEHDIKSIVDFDHYVQSAEDLVASTAEKKG